MLDNKTFVCGIGAQKAGTTFLADYLMKHPEFMMSDLKELHYFDSKFMPKLSSKFEPNFMNRITIIINKLKSGKKINSKLLIALIKRIEASSNDNYRLYFDYYVRKEHLAFGEITPAYSMLKREHFAMIAKQFPKHKFIFLLRNPVDRFWSQINYEIQSRKSDENPLDMVDKSILKKSFLLRSNYKRTIEEIQSVVNKENIYIDFYENIFSDKGNETIEKISNFIGISFRKDLLNNNKKINTTNYKITLDDKTKYKIINELYDTYEYVFANFNNVPQKWCTDYTQYKKLKENL